MWEANRMAWGWSKEMGYERRWRWLKLRLTRLERVDLFEREGTTQEFATSLEVRWWIDFMSRRVYKRVGDHPISSLWARILRYLSTWEPKKSFRLFWNLKTFKTTVLGTELYHKDRNCSGWGDDMNKHIPNQPSDSNLVGRNRNFWLLLWDITQFSWQNL
jgi:hypothetical protein